MIERSLLPDGSVRLESSRGCAFVYSKMAPGVVLVRISGHDTGELGSQPLDELDAELAGARPLKLFIDTREATGAVSAVREAWTEWFQRRQRELERVWILTGSDPVHLTTSMAKILSRTGELIQVCGSAQIFEQALAAAAGRVVALPARERASATATLARAQPPGGYDREVLADGSIRLASERCVFHYRRLRPAVLLVTISGYDSGEFGTATLDEIGAAIGGLPLEVFLDARLATGAAPVVNEQWAAWVIAHRDVLGGIHVLTANKHVSLMIEIVRHLSRTGDLMRLYADIEPFQQALGKAAPGYRLESRPARSAE